MLTIALIIGIIWTIIVAAGFWINNSNPQHTLSKEDVEYHKWDILHTHLGLKNKSR